MDTSQGQSNLFGHADYYANLAAGKSNQEILNWVNANKGQLHSNRFGANELFSQILSGAQQEQQAANRQQEIARQEAARQAEIARQEQLQREAEARQAERLKQMEIGARTQAANTSRAGLQSRFQINSGTQSQKTSGTQGFKRRQLQVNPSAYSALASGAPKQSTLPGVLNP